MDGEPVIMHDEPSQLPPSPRGLCDGWGFLERRTAGAEELLVCRPVENGIRGLHLWSERGGVRWKLVDAAGDDLEPLLQMVGNSRKCRIVCLLPKSQYLVRILELPEAGRDRVLEEIRRFYGG